MSTTRQKEILAKINSGNTATGNVEDTLRFYSQWAPTFDEDNEVIQHKGPEVVAQAVDQILGKKRDAVILDAGAATGVVGVELQKLGFTNLEALDACQAMLDIANQKGIYKRSICDMLGPNRLDIPSGHYDCVVCVGTMAAGNANASCLPELIRITKSGGFVAIATREDYIPDCGYDSRDWDDWLKIHEDNGLWKKVEIRRVEKYMAGIAAGMLYVYQVL